MCLTSRALLGNVSPVAGRHAAAVRALCLAVSGLLRRQDHLADSTLGSLLD